MASDSSDFSQILPIFPRFFRFFPDSSDFSQILPGASDIFGGVAVETPRVCVAAET
jgi:hypothetical protein